MTSFNHQDPFSAQHHNHKEGVLRYTRTFPQPAEPQGIRRCASSCPNHHHPLRQAGFNETQNDQTTTHPTRHQPTAHAAILFILFLRTFYFLYTITAARLACLSVFLSRSPEPLGSRQPLSHDPTTTGLLSVSFLVTCSICQRD
jgi:hypothetical protein